MRLEVALLSIPFAFCLSLFAFRASIATRSSKGVSLSLRTVVYPFFICKSSLSFFLSILYQKSRDFSNVRLSRRFKTCINEKSSIFQQKFSTLKKALKNTKRGCRINDTPKKKKAVVLYRKALNNRLLCCIIELPQTTHKKARILYSNEKQKSSSFTIKFRN